MRIGDSVQLSVDMLNRARRFTPEQRPRQVLGEAAMLHACIAVDATGKRMTGGPVGERFTAAIREHLDILSAVGLPAMDLARTRFPYPSLRVTPKERGGEPDIADLLYLQHRCTLGHGDEVPLVFSLIPHDDVPGNYPVQFTSEAIRLPEIVVYGLLAIVVLAPVNAGERTQDAIVPWARGPLVANDWWGRVEDFRTELESSGFNRFQLDETPVLSPNAPLIDIARATMQRSGIPELKQL
ncbi:hypothetical protein [Gordonia sp. VNK21]|uniref:hypothetical protein n=1 Tax=Gordonia sp. VNK21 TaxID=3382483 RepID=UPI0038D512C0